jgi:hypothetical protein
MNWLDFNNFLDKKKCYLKSLYIKKNNNNISINRNWINTFQKKELYFKNYFILDYKNKIIIKLKIIKNFSK